MPLAERLQIPERLKYVHGVANVVEENVVEFLTCPECLLKLVLVWESDCEIGRRIPLLRDFHYLSADVDAFAIAWSNGSQKVAGPASNR
jgi:hypothetical protein